MGKLEIEVLLRIFDVLYEEKKSGSEAKGYRKFFEAVAKSAPDPKKYIDLLEEISHEWQTDKNILTQQRLIKNMQKRARKINETFMDAFGPEVVEIKCQRGNSWRLHIHKDFFDALQDKSITEVNEFLRTRCANKGRKEVPEITPGQRGTIPHDQKIIMAKQLLSESLDDEESIAGLEGSRYELDKLLDRANESVLIVGQNLHFLVKDEIKAAKKGIDMIGRYRKDLTNWLQKNIRGKVEIVILDLRVEEEVLKSAVKSKKSKSKQKFIDDLCDATARYRVWQEEIDSKHFEVRVSNILPPSLVAIDAKNTDTGLMTLTRYSYGYRTGKRPTHIVQKRFKPEVFKRIYNICRQDIGPEHTKKITNILPTDIEKCRKLKDKFGNQHAKQPL